MLFRAYVAKRYFDWRPHRCIDTRFIFVLVAIGEHIGNSQTEKQIIKNYF